MLYVKQVDLNKRCKCCIHYYKSLYCIKWVFLIEMGMEFLSCGIINIVEKHESRKMGETNILSSFFLRICITIVSQKVMQIVTHEKNPNTLSKILRINFIVVEMKMCNATTPCCSTMFALDHHLPSTQNKQKIEL